MQNYLILRLDAPLMSFGAPVVDNFGYTEHFVSLSSLVGLLANAMCYDHSDAEKLTSLQERLIFAQRCDRPGESLRDFQTVALGQKFLLNENSWTTWGSLDKRKGGKAAQKGTHIRYRDYLADAIYTLTVGLSDKSTSPTLDDLSSALDKPARPLFIGRKPCIPATPLLIDTIMANSPLDALLKVPRINPNRSGLSDDEGLSCWWSANDGGPEPKHFREFTVTDQRDWHNQIHSGQRKIRQGLIYPQEGTHG